MYTTLQKFDYVCIYSYPADVGLPQSNVTHYATILSNNIIHYVLFSTVIKIASQNSKLWPPLLEVHNKLQCSVRSSNLQNASKQIEIYELAHIEWNAVVRSFHR